jgi:two-component system LytT family sensor kinase
MKKKLLRHLLFWIIYFGISLFNDVFLSYSMMDDPSLTNIAKSAMGLVLILLIKIPVVYYVLYSFIPRWQRDENRTKLILELFFVLVIAIIIYRLFIHLIIWTYIWGETPQHMTVLQYIARIFYSLLDILQVVAIAAAIRLLRLRIAAVKKEKALLQEKLHAELQQLKSQVNPHFLFNSLNSIYSLARIQSPQTPDVVMKLSAILRYMLYGNKNVLARAGDEVKLVEDYLELQKVRFGNRRVINVSIKISGDDILVPPLIMLPLLENIYKHSAPDFTATCTVTISEEQMSLHSENEINYAADDQEPEGIGLSNIRRQLQLMYREFEFVYGPHGSRFRVSLTIKLSSYAGDELFDSRR